MDGSGLERDAALLEAFSGPKFNQSNTGWVGPNATAIWQALETGNVRERWALVYILSKTRFLDSVFAPLAETARSTNNMAPLEALGLNPGEVLV